MKAHKNWLPNDPRVENVLKKYEISSHVQEIPTGDRCIDEQASLHNQAREESIDEETVKLYQNGFLAGDKFPPLVGMHVSKGSEKVMWINGNQRYQAAKRAGIPYVLAYLIPTIENEETLLLVCMELNAFESNLPLTVSQRVRAAIHYINVHGVTARVAAQKYHVSDSSIKRAKDALETAQRLEKLKSPVKGLSDSVLSCLGNLKLSNVLLHAANVAKNAGLSGDNTQDMVRKILDADTELGMLGVVQEQAQQYGVPCDRLVERKRASNSTRRDAQATTLKRLISSLISCFETPTVKRYLSQFGISDPEEKREVLEKIKALIGHLTRTR